MVNIDFAFGILGLFAFTGAIYLNARAIDNLQRLRESDSIRLEIGGFARVWRIVAVTFVIGGIGLLIHYLGIATEIYADYIGALIAIGGIFYLMWSTMRITAGVEERGEADG